MPTSKRGGESVYVSPGSGGLENSTRKLRSFAVLSRVFVGDGVLVFVFISVFVFVCVCVISSAWGSFVVVEGLAQLAASSCLSESLATASRSHAGLQRGGQEGM